MKKYPHERDYDENGMTPSERKEHEAREISKAVYRGHMWAKRGWDPGDPDDDNPILWAITIIGVLVVGGYYTWGEIISPLIP